MDYWLTEEQLFFRESVRRWLREEYLPARKLTDPAAMADFAVARWDEMARLGWLAASFPEAVGGVGGSLTETALLLEELGRALLPSPYLSTVGLAGHLLRVGGSAAQKQAWLPGLCEGRQRFAVSLESGIAGSGDRLSGHVALVHDLPVAQQVIVAASHERGPSLFLVPLDAAGVEVTAGRLQDGRHAGSLRLAGVEVGPEQHLGEAGALIEELRDVGAALASIEAVGALWALHDLTLDYLKTRRQFGQTLGAFQALQHRMVDLHTQCQMAQSLAMDAVAALERDAPAPRRLAVSAAKVGVGQAARRVGEEAVQLHGGIGMTLDYAAGHYLKRLTAFRAEFGDERHHLGRYAAALAGETA